MYKILINKKTSSIYTDKKRSKVSMSITPANLLC